MHQPDIFSLPMYQALIVLGASTLGAKSAFVLTTGKAAHDSSNPLLPAPSYDFDEFQLRLWNPLSGGCSSVKDATADLREVGGNWG